jgi:hypothetical protein
MISLEIISLVNYLISSTSDALLWDTRSFNTQTAPSEASTADRANAPAPTHIFFLFNFALHAL